MRQINAKAQACSRLQPCRITAAARSCCARPLTQRRTAVRATAQNNGGDNDQVCASAACTALLLLLALQTMGRTLMLHYQAGRMQ